MLPPLLATISEPSLLLNSRYDLYVIAATTGMTSDTLGQSSALAGIAVSVQERGVDLLHAGLEAQVRDIICTPNRHMTQTIADLYKSSHLLHHVFSICWSYR
jgi:hypothetical protein